MKNNPRTHILTFDVDITLAPSGEELCEHICGRLDYLTNVVGYQLAFATARSYSELEKRIPKSILHNAYTFTCFGMELWHQGNMKHQHFFKWPQGLKDELRELLSECDCPDKVGNHFNIRPCAAAFTPLGQGATAEQRANFIEWNNRTNGLNKMRDHLRKMFPELHIEAFGATSIDFSDHLMCKASILPELRKRDNRDVAFFGDGMHEGGNDLPLAKALLAENLPLNDKRNNFAFHVNHHKETLDILRNKF